MAVECTRCQYIPPTEPGGKNPPWCPRCGSDMKACVPATPAFLLAGAGASTARSAQPAQDALPTRPSRVEESPPAGEIQASAPASLDNPQQVYRASILWQAVAWLCALVCFGIVAIVVSQLVNPPHNKKPQTAAILALTALFGSGGLALAYVGLTLRGLKYLVFPDRLVQVQGGRAYNLPWNEIREVYRSVHPAWQKYRLVARQGREVKLTSDIKGHKRLGELISERVAELLFPDALRRLEDGAPVSFGPIHVSRGGIVCNGEQLPWQQVVSLTFGLNPREVKGTRRISNMIHLRITPSCMVEMGDIPNFRVFEKLVRMVHPTCVPETVG